ncbi:pre-mRNA-splicing factor CWC24-like isoform X2 [Oryza brachyantha]|uniref:pre-mRNA-splicing factor CWC24-like isoform X2 n=1 Tax=Oryza brachyantha TaxID=4533 RepID=UPI00077624D7|nr:pre-mRNA-splicing factor CWC24-like isoform X2 [Oryza brachyantha]
MTSTSTVRTARSRKRAYDDSRQNVDVINLDTTVPVVKTRNQREALILRSRKVMRRPVDVVDLEKDTGQGGYGVAVAIFSRGINCKGAPPVICLSPDREEGTSFQAKNVGQISTAPKEPIFTCPVCLNKLDQPFTTKCGHIFCENCIKSSIKAQKKCPTCRKSLGMRGFHRVYLPATAD